MVIRRHGGVNFDLGRMRFVMKSDGHYSTDNHIFEMHAFDIFLVVLENSS